MWMFVVGCGELGVLRQLERKRVRRQWRRRKRRIDPELRPGRPASVQPLQDFKRQGVKPRAVRGQLELVGRVAQQRVSEQIGRLGMHAAIVGWSAPIVE